MIKVGIVGSEGFVVGELIGLLLQHPDVTLEKVYSPDYEGLAVSKLHPGLFDIREIFFSADPDFSMLDVLFICLNSCYAKEFYQRHRLAEHIKIIDFSYELRPLNHEREEGSELNLERSFVYGLPELNRREICNANAAAVPGSFAHSVGLGLLAAAKNLLVNKPLHISSIIGRTERMARPGHTVNFFDSFSDRITLYQPFEHRQEKEIRYILKTCQQNFSNEINFLSIRGNFVRGTYTYIYFNCDLSIEEIKGLYQKYYEDHSFIRIVEEIPDIRQIVNTNFALLFLKKFDNKLLITTVQDNLLKGSAGTAVHIMNLMCGLVETTGLKLKSIAY